MTFAKLRELVENENRPMTTEEIRAGLALVLSDMENDNFEHFTTYTLLHFRIQIQEKGQLLHELHAVDQRYLNHMQGNPKYSVSYVAWIYSKFIEYFTTMQNSPECIRYINILLEMKGVKPVYRQIASGYALTLFRDSSLKAEVKPYLEIYRSFLDTPDISDLTFIEMSINLIELYIRQGMTDDYPIIRERVQKVKSKITDTFTRCNLDMYLLAGDLILDHRPVSPVMVDSFKRCINDMTQNTSAVTIVNYVILAIASKMRSYITDAEMIRLLLKCIRFCDSPQDRISIYSYMTQTLKLDRKKYREIYDSYFDELCLYYDSIQNIDQQELLNEISFHKTNRRRESELRRLSETDLLTGIRNRGSGELSVKNLMKQDVHGTMFVIDVDHFKKINDSFGHSIGDDVLKAIAECLSNTFKRDDIIFRLGGDEFAVYAPNLLDETPVKTACDRLFKYISAISIPEMKGQPVTLSVGATIYKQNEKHEFDVIYKRADSGTYISKPLPGNALTIK